MATAWLASSRLSPPRTFASALIQDAGASFRPDWAMALRLTELDGRGVAGRRRGARPAVPGSRRGGEPGELPLAARSVRRPTGRHLISRSRKKPARAPAHSGWRPMIHEAVSLRLASAAVRTGDLLRIEAAPVHLVERDQGGAA